MQNIWNTPCPQAQDLLQGGDRLTSRTPLLSVTALGKQDSGGAIVFIDSRVDDYESLAAGVNPGIEVIVLDPRRDGVEQITEVLLRRSNVYSLHLVSHGSPGNLQLGATQLNHLNLESQANHLSLQRWGAALTAEADILLYGCSVAADDAGAAFVQRLSELTGTKVAASINRTGSAALGGDWKLEFTTGDIKAGLAFQPSVMKAYSYVMGTTLYDGTTPTVDASQLAYAQIPFPPFAPLAPGAFTNTLNTNFQNGTAGYAGYTNYNPQSAPLTLLNPAFPTLDRTTGFTLSFNVAVTAETSTSNNRAGFSITALSDDLQGIELGFSNNLIFAQAQTPLFTRAEEIGRLLNQATTYDLTIFGNEYTLSINRDPILRGQLRNYSAFDQAASNPPLPFDPYELRNFLFFGDNTDQANAQFTLGAISVNAFPVANSNDGYSTPEDTPLTIPLANTVLANDTDADANDQLTAVLEQGPTSGTLVLNPDGTFTYTPVANFSGIVSFTYRASDGTANSNTAATVVLAVNPVADTPTLSVTPASGLKDTAIPLSINAALVDTDGSETLSLQIAGVPTGAALSAGTNLGNGVWQLSAANLAGLTLTPAPGDETDFTLSVTATATETANNSTASNATSLAVTVTVDPTIPDPDPTNPEPSPPGLVQTANGIFTVQGSTPLLFALAERNTNLVNEIGVFAVDNAQGSIGNLNLGDAGYAEAALDRAQVLFSVLANNPSSATFTRQLSITSGTFLSFYQVENSTTDAVRSGQTPLSAISFGSAALSGNTLDFGALRFSASPTNQPFLVGTGFQGDGQGELIDLTQLVGGQLDANFTVNSEAAYDNFIGFYAINQLDGGIDVNSDGQIDFRPGDADYAEIAMQRTVLQASLQGTRSVTGSVPLDAGTLLAPYIIADGAIAEFLASNPDNQPGQVPHAYFAFLAANPDGADHVRLLGDNTFGLEDLFGGGDADFNDVVIQVNIT